MGDTTEARRVRSARAAYLRDLGSGRRSLRKVLKTPPAILEKVYIIDLLMATHNLGPSGCRKILDTTGIDGAHTLEELDLHQRKSLLNSLPKRAK